MKTVDLSQASKALSDYAEDLGDEPIILLVEGKPVAALVSLRNVDEESLGTSTSPEFLRLMQAAREEIESGDFISLEEMKREFS
jgi:antitoxin (DNA-binding transcriptional repressor) of toxin-antitoxin stability system